MPRTRPAHTPLADVPAPDHAARPAFTACPACGATVLTSVCHLERGWRRLPEAVSPVLGERHVCQKEGATA